MGTRKISRLSSVNMMGILLIGIPFLFHLGVVAVMAEWMYSSLAALRIEEESRTLITSSSRIMRTAAGAGVTAAVYSMTGVSAIKERFLDLRKDLDREIVSLERYVRNKKEKKLLVRDLLAGTRAAGEQLGELIEKSNGQVRLGKKTVSPPLDRAGTALKTLLRTEHVQTKEAARIRDKKNRQVENLIKTAILIDVCIAFVVAYLIYRLLISRLARVRLNIRRFSQDSHYDDAGYGHDEISLVNRQLSTIAKRFALNKEANHKNVLFLKEALKVPLASLVENISILMTEQALTGKAKEKLDSCITALSRANNMIDRLTRIDTLAEQSVQHQLSRFDLIALIEESKGAIESPEKVTLQVRYPAGENKLELEADRNRISQLLAALLHSSQNDTRVSQIEIDVKQEERVVEIRFVENGVNKPSILRGAIHNSFGNENINNDLETCWAAVDSHDGKISVETKDDAKSTVWIRLPVASGRGRSVATGGFLSSLAHSSLMRRILAISLPPVLLTTMSAIVLLTFADQTSKLIHRESLSQEMVLILNEVMIDSTNAFRSMIGTLLGSAGKAQHVAHYTSRRDEHLKSFEALSGIKTNELAEDFNRTFRRWEGILESRPAAADSEDWRELVDIGDVVGIIRDTTRINDKIDRLVSLEQTQLENQQKHLNASLDNLKVCLLTSTCLTLIVAIQAYLLFRKRFANRMANVLSNTERLIAKEPMIDPVPGEDELAELDFSFQAAVSRLRNLDEIKTQTASIVNHDIRTPLFLVRNVLFMMHRGVWGENSGTTEKALSDCVDLVDRLTRLCLLLIELEKTGLDEASREDMLSRHQQAIADLHEISPASARAMDL